MKKKSYLTVTDQFCGAGGSSAGAKKVLNKVGGEITLALNHWKLAIETHNTNFPEAIHECTDISACDPRRYPSTDILITSPECTNHSVANGKKKVQTTMDLFNKNLLDPAAERSRATMWDVPRFAEYHKYQIVIVENVVDARKWFLFPAWLQAMHLLGYLHECKYINSMHIHPTPQSRDRMYVIFWKKNNPKPNLDLRPKAHCEKCGHDVEAVQTWKNNRHFGKYKTQYTYNCPTHGLILQPYYYAAANAIDWTDLGNRIGDREKPLSPNTVNRINFGLNKYGKDPFIFHRAYSKEARGIVKDITNPAFTQTTLESQAICNPFIINDQNSTGIDCRVKDVKDVSQTVTGTPNLKLVTPFIIKLEHSKAISNVKNIFEPLQTQTTRQSMALVIENKGMSNAKSITDAASTVTTVSHHGLLNSFLHGHYGNGTIGHISDPVGTLGTIESHALCSYEIPKIEDCYYRMIKPYETKNIMAFDSDYIIIGSGKDQVKQLGNAVTPPVMEWLVDRCISTLL